MLSEANQARHRENNHIIEQQTRRKEATEEQRQTEAISRASNFLRESRILSLLEATKNNLNQSGYNFIDLKVHKKGQDELGDYSFPRYIMVGDIVVVYLWGSRNQHKTMYSYHGLSVSISGDGEIDIPHHHYVGSHKDDCPPVRFSSPEWHNNRGLLEDSLWAAYKNPFPLNYQDEENRRRWRKKPPRSHSYSHYEGDEGPCLPGNSLISTPHGFLMIKDLQVGDIVWTSDGFGRRVQTVIVKKTKRIVSKNHKVAHIILKDGRELIVSPGHPTIDYKQIGSLVKGDDFDMSSVASIKVIPYKGKYTYDILPYGDTGGYWVNNILIGSTLSSQFEKMENQNFPYNLMWL